MHDVGFMAPGGVLTPASPSAAEIAAHAWLLLGLGAVVYATTLVALALAAWRRRDAGPEPPAGARRAAAAIVLVAAVTALVVGVLLVLSLRSVNALRPAGPPDLRVQVVGYRWWWAVRYPEHGIVTANEVHVPAGASVELELTAQDVIHSFWVPTVHGKLDLIPGRVNTLRIRVPAPGIHAGHCAEFCGIQHTRMRLHLVVHEPAAFQAWVAAERSDAAPAEEARRPGEALFMAWCLSCHTVRGTPAAGQVGPDLTHVARRGALAAGTLPNTPEALAAWIADPQALKPGALMPTLPLAPEAVRAVTAYVAGLR